MNYLPEISGFTAGAAIFAKGVYDIKKSMTNSHEMSHKEKIKGAAEVVLGSTLMGVSAISGYFKFSQVQVQVQVQSDICLPGEKLNWERMQKVIENSPFKNLNEVSYPRSLITEKPVLNNNIDTNIGNVLSLSNVTSSNITSVYTNTVINSDVSSQEFKDKSIVEVTLISAFKGIESLFYKAIEVLTEKNGVSKPPVTMHSTAHVG